MKVYVEEMPKSCITCKMCYFDSAIRHNKCSLNSIVSQNNYRDIDCPLQSIQDHDKEVRQQVCDEIREKINKLLNKQCEKWVIKPKDYNDYGIFKILDQIEKGDKK